MNADKTNYLIFTGNKRIGDISNIVIGGVVPKRLYISKYLGVLIYEKKINWKENVAYIHNKISRYSSKSQTSLEHRYIVNVILHFDLSLLILL